MPRFVPDDGRMDAPIVVVGEQPGKQEDRELVPFSGPAGMKLNRWIEQAGASRRDCYVTNVIPFFTPNKLKDISKEDKAKFIGQLHDRLDALRDPQIIVPLGNLALSGVLGARAIYDKKSKQRLTITKARGFLFDANVSERTVRTIPTIHPAAIFRDPSAERACELDWTRIVAESRRTISRPLTFKHNVRPSLRTVADWVSDAIEQGGPVSIDIETVGDPEPKIMCLGFSWDGRESYVVPVADYRYWPERLVPRVVAHLKRLCESDVPKVVQSGLYDSFWLKMQYGIEMRNAVWDLRFMHFAWLPQDFAHDLAYLASTELPLMRYWKDECKSAEESAKYASDMDALHAYNGIDNCVQWRLAEPLRAKLERSNRWQVYLDNFVALFPELLEIMCEGIPVDEGGRREVSERVVGEAVAAGWEAMRVVGRSLLGKTEGAKKVSDALLKKLLYEEWGLAKLRSRVTGALTVDEVALRKLRLRYAKRPQVVALLDAVLIHRRKFQLSLFARENRVGEGGRMRCAYSFAETLRLTSSESPYGDGSNTQNIDREFRGTFRARPGEVLLELDQSTAESRIVYILTGDRALIERALSQPWEFDDHATTASVVFGIPLGEFLTRYRAKDAEAGVQRYLGKRTNHASNYDMQGLTMSEQMLKDGFVYTAEECDGMLEARHADVPGIRKWHKQTQRILLSDERLVNSWGWEWTIDGRLLGPGAYRAAYAFIPQSEVGMLTNRQGVIPFRRARIARGWRSRILIQGHDSVVVSAPPAEAWPVYRFLAASLGKPRKYGMPGGKQVELAMPIELATGLNWGERTGKNQTGMQKWKRPPSREEFEIEMASLCASLDATRGSARAGVAR